MGLTVKQDKFARLAASGMPKLKAYTAAGYSRKSTDKTIATAGAELAKHPEVSKAIVRYELEEILECFPQYQDVAALRMHGVRNMARMARGNDPVAYKASEWLVNYADSLERAQNASTTEEQSDVVRDLRKLYKEALAAQAPLVVESSAEPDSNNSTE